MNAPDIPVALDRRPFVWSFSALDAYDKCPHQMAHRYIWKTTPYVESPAMKWGNDIHAAFELRVGGKKPLPNDMQKWEPFAAPFDQLPAIAEQKLGVTELGQPTGFFDKDVFGRGKVDVTVLAGDTAYIADWKSGGSNYESPFELQVCAVLLHAKHPQLKRITGNYVWLKEDRIGQVYDLSNTLETWNTICGKVTEITARRAAQEFEKKPSGLCGYCSVKTCEHWRERK